MFHIGKQNQIPMETLSSFTALFEKAARGSTRTRTFYDFLSLCIYDFTKNPCTGFSFYEKEYHLLRNRYLKSGRLEYLQLLSAELVNYVNKHRGSSYGNDLLGEFFEREICRGKSGYFFPHFQVETMMAQMLIGEDGNTEHLFDPCCFSGRIFLAVSQKFPDKHLLYYGLDMNPVFTKIGAINLFMAGLTGEVGCGNIYVPGDFSFGYRISQTPHGIFKIENGENSLLRHFQDFAFSKIINDPFDKKVIRYFQFWFLKEAVSKDETASFLFGGIYMRKNLFFDSQALHFHLWYNLFLLLQSEAIGFSYLVVFLICE